jgi:hypothetical protein
MQDSYTVCAERTTFSEIVWTHPMQLQGDVGRVKSDFGTFGDSAGVGSR